MPKINSMRLINSIGAVVGIVAGAIAIYTFVKPMLFCPRYDISGTWYITTKVQSVGKGTNFTDQINDENIFHASLTQNCREVSGNATKAFYNGDQVTSYDRSFLDFTGSKISKKSVELIFTEIWQANNNKSNGKMSLVLNPSKNTMNGQLFSTTGGIGGIVTLER